ncbi:DMT family transporter [Nocardia sp. NEAU-351]|uniref:DMT family transporter n=1 Tax=Nocardia bovistercoris TaxID=2785916 RepID=A0A931N4K6_9NOCA|nr:DMT family transporter [Nocardia bovistercoris]MBH0778969.1 DMT family transporter [Nocardia bovistercoris]
MVCGFCIGAGVAVQGRINGALGVRLHDGIAAATVSFAVGFAILGAAFASSSRLRQGADQVRRGLADGTLRPWQLAGGLCGALFVGCQGLTIAAIGVTAFTVAAVAGQLSSSLAVDRLGLAPGGRTPVTVARASGAAIAIGAVLLAGLDHSRAGSVAAALPRTLDNSPTWLLIAAPAVAGVGLAWQQAVNGRVAAVGGPMSAALVNFGVGLVALLALESILWANSGRGFDLPTEPWLYLGGAIGVGFIALAAVTVGRLGVLLLGLTSVAGQLGTALVLDVVAPTDAGISPMAVAGCALTLVAVGVATVRRPGERHAPSNG